MAQESDFPTKESTFRRTNLQSSSTEALKYLREALNEDRVAIEDDRRAGRPATATSEGTMAIVRNLVEGDRRVTIRRIARMAGISLHSAFGVLHETLGLRKLPARWFPKALREEQLVRRVNLSGPFNED
ncbi:hypothetical protein M514_27124 [Trichuris suis]|uniref:Uncharacterized protein n=1 Tax=Trichuris suis TaxID=68888 RepID=A0A085MTZ7_9BILA|nr:hypothetical protein M514_27124 [Trichuris suis]